MIINDLSLLATKLEVWKQYLELNPSPENQILTAELNIILLSGITPESLLALDNFIEAREATH